MRSQDLELVHAGLRLNAAEDLEFGPDRPPMFVHGSSASGNKGGEAKISFVIDAATKASAGGICGSWTPIHTVSAALRSLCHQQYLKSPTSAGGNGSASSGIYRYFSHRPSQGTTIVIGLKPVNKTKARIVYVGFGLMN